MAQKAASFVVDFSNEDDKSKKREIAKKTGKTLVSAVRAKYCMEHDGAQFSYITVYHGRHRKTSSSEDAAELEYLTNVCLSDSNIRRSGLEEKSITTMCPNVVDLDISGNKLDSWKEILPVMEQLKSLKFLNIARNAVTKGTDVLHGWTGPLPGLENLVLNETRAGWKEILHLTSLLPHLKELHVCGNNYTEIPAGKHNGLHSVECLRMNNNSIANWNQVWKLRHLPKLKSLILSGNPLTDIFYGNTDNSLHGNTDNSLHGNTDKSLNGNTDNSLNGNTDNSLHGNTDNILHHNTDTSLHGNAVASQGNMNESIQDEVRQYCENVLNSVIDDVIKGDIVSEQEMFASGLENAETEAAKDPKEFPTPKENDLQNVNEKKQSEKTEKQTNVNPAINDDLDQQLSREIVEHVLQRAIASVTNTDIGKANASQTADKVRKDNQNPLEKCSDNQSTEKLNRFLNGEVESPLEAHNIEESVKGQKSCCPCIEEPPWDTPFKSLETLCVSETQIGKWKHLDALRGFPALRAVRIKNVKLGSKLTDEDRRKLFLASLPNISLLNGSEVTPSEREKSERHLLRHFCEKKQKPDIYPILEQKHGKVTPLVDIDISKGYTDFATLSFFRHGKEVFTETVRLREPVGSLRNLIRVKLGRHACYGTLYHKHCSSRHDDTMGELEEMRCDSLPMSRVDIYDGDEIHIDDSKQIPAKHTVLHYFPFDAQLQPAK